MTLDDAPATPAQTTIDLPRDVTFLGQVLPDAPPAGRPGTPATARAATSTPPGSTPLGMSSVANGPPADRLDALAESLQTLRRATIIFSAIPPMPTTMQMADLREAMDVLSLCVADPVSGGKELLAAKEQDGFLLGPYAYAAYSMGSTDAALSKLEDITMAGLPLSEGVVMKRGFRSAHGVAPRVFAAVHGDPRVVETFASGLREALDVPENKFRVADCGVAGLPGARAVILVELPLEIVARAWATEDAAGNRRNDITRSAAGRRWLASLDQLHAKIEENNGNSSAAEAP